MKLVTFDAGEGPRTGAIIGDGSIVDLAAAAPEAERGMLSTMLALIEGGEPALDAAREIVARSRGDHGYDPAYVRYLPPLPVPNSIRDFANFELHCLQALEASMRMRAASQPDPEAAYAGFKASGAYDLPASWYQRPYYFKGNRMTCSGHDSVIQWPRFSGTMDYELEFAAVIGTRGADIAEADADAHIFGYMIYNDFSARDEQVRDQQFRMGPSKGKDFDTGNAMGPWIVTRDELPDVSNLAMTSRINGEVQGRSNSSGMQFSFAQCIAFVSRDETLYPGDVFGSGTAGNGCGFETGRYLEPGDVIELEVEGIGVLRNRIGERRS
ncbi:fumarylacetoacetate hydrolase family protein [Sphingomonas koreensis]|uniref:fumarylacetoacetate hydrolase family protein n=1 Tax=Sphingomonas koreensis TaxID=93064 RepID=UPI00082FFD8D|nr:fumarylacetoacetate hydrolase family protein [Sphingomonas koreensis]PJI88405.1 fumarylacetoacetase-like protein [Sphingomonas koreensis]RSU58673.1 fumarylacetoacetate hydrolase family protein [Sphingomonas koreensis]RSU66838.1 fumarylacetoacetate hydrolase family protein [Sphingomonas koreensis]